MFGRTNINVFHNVCVDSTLSCMPGKGVQGKVQSKIQLEGLVFNVKDSQTAYNP